MTKRGFTLVEVLTTVVILSIGIVAIHQGFGRCLHALRSSEQSLYASEILQRCAIDFELKLWPSTESFGKEAEAPKPDLPAGYVFSYQKNAARLGNSNFDHYDLKLLTPAGDATHTAILLNIPEKKK